LVDPSPRAHRFCSKKIGPVNSMTAKDNSWAAAAEAKLNATHARYIQRTGDQPRALVSELAPRPATADLGLFNPQQMV
jgi:hypothetical protein